MAKPTQAEQSDAEVEDRPAPNYKEPKIQYPSYQDFANDGPGAPMYIEGRGYKEYR